MPIELKVPEQQLGKASIASIKRMLDSRFGDEWKDFELETISLDLGILLDDLLRDKICLLQVQEHLPATFWADPFFFVYASQVINNVVADFETFIIPTSLELAFAIEEMKQLWPIEPQYEVKKVIEYVLNEEGYTSVPAPFNYEGVSVVFPPIEAKKEDMSKKEAAIKLYIKGMKENGGL